MEWSRGDSKAQFLWIEGPGTDVTDSERSISMVAARLVASASLAEVPVISYFCELLRSVQLQYYPASFPEEQAAVALASALIRQTVEVLLPKFDTNFDLSRPRFEQLNGTFQSWDVSMEVLADLLSLVPGTAFCVIDGIHWLDSQRADKYLRAFVEVLRNSTMKIMFTTSGRSGCLLEEIPVSETIQVMRMPAIGTQSLTEHLILEQFRKRRDL
ncbi:uncharacterized protein E0L32_002096 [Thyridium curvatum]|uniref:Orc1-like AAA ATPase domain-containing protein n=1 Tax=Thyridium curvatum TaxID=1093900 RepID=A0A507AMH9_9PEZI|nr:uncharacterized protein E0L32_002037 [Thyridium curvatum]XP_030989204.1 uncharacterized protein E0L32_002096 [Thyridium curvatum]TPX07434.1 hypothetical protein E0L32_002037 [Thyridium curvatum]TPX07493.1 hypothetical protein E0L32_002096 [Thyridium curvatum]